MSKYRRNLRNVLHKARSHKYIRRTPDGKSGWRYFYARPSTGRYGGASLPGEGLPERIIASPRLASDYAALQPPQRLDRRAPAGHYQIWFARPGERDPYITDVPSIQLAMREAKKTAALAGVGPVVIYDDLGNQFKTMQITDDP